MADKTVDTGVDSSEFFVDPFEGIGREFSNISTLYAGKHTLLLRAQRYGRWFVLKTLNEDIADQAAYLQVLRKELEVLMQMQHPGVVQAVGLEQVTGFGSCIIMEYIEGETLQQLLGGNEQLTLGERRRIGRELCDAVAYVHSQGIVHRDLKPENIMLTRSGRRVKLIDFGLADTDQHAVLKQPAGTLNYMAPEQASQLAPDVCNDIYSLGMILQELNLEGVWPAVIAHCLRPIDERYDSVAALLSDVDRRQQRRKRLWQTALAAVVVAMMVMAAVVGRRMLTPAGDNVAGLAAIDSLQRQMAQQQTENASRLAESQMEQVAIREQMGRSMATLSDSINRLTSANKQLQAELNRSDRVKAEALQALKQVIRRSQIDHHLDTLSQWRYRWTDLSNRTYNVSNFIYQYADQLKLQMGQQEVDQVLRVMLDYWKEWSMRVSTRANVIRLKESMPSPDSTGTKSGTPDKYLL
jgi:serine/threonine protein kinase